MNNFSPVKLALTLPKGYAKEYRDRDLFNPIYFSKLSMFHEQEGYIPILYNFALEHEQDYQQKVPNSMLMTFYYPQTRRMSKLNGIVILGGRPDIYEAYQVTKLLTPYLESLTLNKHNLSHDRTIAVIDESLEQLAEPTKIKSLTSILERSTSKSGRALESFFPFLADKKYNREKLSLPDTFNVDAVFMLGISPSFFRTTTIGAGIQTLRLYHYSNSQIPPSLAFPLIFKWQPIYNDILAQLQKDEKILPPDYKGQLIPSVVIFQQQDSDEMTALISTISRYQDRLYYHVAVANSGHPDGQPLSLVQAALGREKFGKEEWIKKLDNINYIPEDSIRDTSYASDLMTSKLNLVVPETDLTSEDGSFDLGKLRSIHI